MTAAIRQRSAIPADLPYVLSTWVRGLQRLLVGRAGRGKQVERDARVTDIRRRYIDRVMAQNPHIVVLCSPNQQTALHGYAVALEGALAWVYVTKDLRGHGLARQAISGALGAYPDTIPVHCAWPSPSTRFQFQRLQEEPRHAQGSEYRVPYRPSGAASGHEPDSSLHRDYRHARDAGRVR